MSGKDNLTSMTQRWNGADPMPWSSLKVLKVSNNSLSLHIKLCSCLLIGHFQCQSQTPCKAAAHVGAMSLSTCGVTSTHLKDIFVWHHHASSSIFSPWPRGIILEAWLLTQFESSDAVNSQNRGFTYHNPHHPTSPIILFIQVTYKYTQCMSSIQFWGYSMPLETFY